MFCILSKWNNTIIVNIAPTWVMIKYDIKKILVSPGNIEFVLLEKRHQHFLPLQWKSCHIILEVGNTATIIHLSFYTEKKGINLVLQWINLSILHPFKRSCWVNI